MRLQMTASLNYRHYELVRLTLTSFAAACLSACFVGCIGPGLVSFPTDETARPLRVSAIHGCPRADTCTVSLADVPPPLGDHISIRLAGIDVPDSSSACKGERMLALDARRFMEKELSRGTRIQMTDVSRDEQFRLIGRLVVDGEDVGSQLLKRGLAVPHNGGPATAQWCVPVN
jgi:hypothetical protein